MEPDLIMAGARIERSVWLRFAALAKECDKPVARLLQETLEDKVAHPQRPKVRPAPQKGKK